MIAKASLSPYGQPWNCAMRWSVKSPRFQCLPHSSISLRLLKRIHFHTISAECTLRIWSNRIDSDLSREFVKRSCFVASVIVWVCHSLSIRYVKNVDKIDQCFASDQCFQCHPAANQLDLTAFHGWFARVHHLSYHTEVIRRIRSLNSVVSRRSWRACGVLVHPKWILSELGVCDDKKNVFKLSKFSVCVSKLLSQWVHSSKYPMLAIPDIEFWIIRGTGFTVQLIKPIIPGDTAILHWLIDGDTIVISNW